VEEEAVKFLWKWKHFEEAGSGSKKYSTASTSLISTQISQHKMSEQPRKTT